MEVPKAGVIVNVCSRTTYVNTAANGEATFP